MLKKKVRPGKSSNIEDTLNRISLGKKAPIGIFWALLALYILTCVIVSATAGSNTVIEIAGSTIGVYAFAGVFSAISNICIIFMVMYYGKLGFRTSLIALIIQFPILFAGIIIKHNMTSIPGAFTHIFTIIAICFIYMNNNKIEKYQARLRDQAVTDRLTELPNRFACTELVNELVKNGEKFALVSIDLNNFKSINSTMGHITGNKVLNELAARWKSAADSGSSGTVDFITRQSGDEFSLIIRGYKTDEDIINTITYYKSILEQKITMDECDFFLTACFGFVRFPDDTKNSDTLFSYADAALYEVKSNGNSNCIMQFSPDQLKIGQTLDIERNIRNALENDLIYFELQPQFDISHKLRGFEALARMKDSNGKQISPGEFIPVAEKAGLIDKVDDSVIKHSVHFFGELIKKTGTDITLSVNISVKHLMKNGFLDELREIIKNCDVPMKQLEIEITESIMIDSAEKALHCIKEIKKMGIQIAIDDFGTGYSSLSYLSSFPADLIKVDKSFIDKMNSSDSSKQYVAAIISIGHIMNFDVISEGVEEPEQLETLKSIGCDYIQGYIWGRPLSPENAEKLVSESIKQ